MSVQVWIPESAREPVAFRCTVPGCDLVFTADERVKWQRHVGGCARANMDRIHAMVAPRGSRLLYEDFDPEATVHLRGVGRRMVEERRFEMRPNEKIVNG